MVETQLTYPPGWPLHRFWTVTELPIPESCSGRGFLMPLYDLTSIWKRTDAFRLQPQASARHHWASRASVADMALLTWFLLWLPTYKESCCVWLLSASLSQVAFDSSKPDFADRPSSRVSDCISQWSSCWGGCRILNRAFIHMTCMFIQSNMWKFYQKRINSCTCCLCRNQYGSDVVGFFVVYLWVTQWCRKLSH